LRGIDIKKVQYGSALSPDASSILFYALVNPLKYHLTAIKKKQQQWKSTLTVSLSKSAESNLGKLKFHCSMKIQLIKTSQFRQMNLKC